MPSEIELVKQELSGVESAIARIGETLSDMKKASFNFKSTVSPRFYFGGNWIYAASIGVFIVAASLVILSAFYMRAELSDAKNDSKHEVGQLKQEVLTRVSAMEAELKRTSDRNQDYFGMHLSKIDQLKARLDQLQETRK